VDYFHLLFVQLSLMSNKDKYRWQQGGNKIQILLTRQKKINMQKATVKSIKGTELT